ncbi:hypothetical protein [Haloferax larsenii]|uniref:Uncharacterized protein n=1 Tax=Haloferax larsenii TaxID=302484 RepID=A0A1H7J7K4_HALLR|nr:hypothetical protein [Haloferax larsenii]SEK70546.1 hypothetical protein SAMN04488691_1011122 [Haloferax larsenii]
MAGDTRTVAALALAALVALTAIAGPVAAAPSTVYPTDEDAALVVTVDWSDTAVSSGDTATLSIENVTGSSNADIAIVTVRNASGTDTYWLPAAEYNIPTSSDAMTEVDVVLEDTTLGTASSLSASEVSASSTLEVAPGEGVSANITAGSWMLDDELPATVEVSVYDGGALLNQSTHTLETNSSTVYAEHKPALETATNVTVVVTNETDQYSAARGYVVGGFDVSTFGDTVGGGGGGDGDGSSDRSTMYVIGAVVVAASGYVTLKDD